MGTPLCADCYDYEGAVIFNARATQLWTRTTITLGRALAQRLDIPVHRFAAGYALSFVKVVEYQRRGVVHLHGLIRLDRRDGGPPDVDVSELAVAVHSAAKEARAPNPLDATRPIRWGRQVDVVPVGQDDRLRASRYLAKYATKSTDDLGSLDHRLRPADLEHLVLSDHLRRMVETAFRLGARRQLVGLNLGRWAHTLGYRGHWLTKSRHWSTTFGALRTARIVWRRQHGGSGLPILPEDDDAPTIEEWVFRGTGYRNEGEALLAESAANNLRENRRAAWEDR